eukprot:jgi/Undpi1/10493/HiC_scaffold_29.g12943.m1
MAEFPSVGTAPNTGSSTCVQGRQGGAQSAPTVPSRVERGAPVGAEGCQNWSASSARNSLARKQGERPGWSDVMHAVIFKQSEELWPNVRTAVVPDPAEWLDSRLTSTRKLRSWASGERAVLFPVEEQELGSEASPGDNPGCSVLSRIVLIIHKGDDGLLLLGHPTMVSQLGIDVENILANLPANVAEVDIRCTIASLAAARGAYSDPDPSTALLTDQAPPLVSAPDEEMQKWVRLTSKGVDKAAKGGMDTEAWADLSSVLTDFTRRFRAGRRPQRMCRLRRFNFGRIHAPSKLVCSVVAI